MKAHRDKYIGGYHYKGYYFCKPEGCTNWNVYSKVDEEIDFCFPICYPESFKNCKETVDSIVGGRDESDPAKGPE